MSNKLKRGMQARLLRNAVTARRVVRWSDRLLTSRLNQLAGIVATANAVEQIIDQVIDVDIPSMCYYLLNRVGVPILPSDPLSAEGVSAALSRKFGIVFRDITDVDKTIKDIEREAMNRIEAHTGLVLDGFDEQNLIKGAQDLLVKVVRNQAPSVLNVSAFAGECAKVAKDSYREGGLVVLKRPWSEHARRWNHREAQRRYGGRLGDTMVFEDLGKTSGAGKFKTSIKEARVEKLYAANKRRWWYELCSLKPNFEGWKREPKPIRWRSSPAWQERGLVHPQIARRVLLTRSESERRWAQLKRMKES
jgi:hypothetical protein